MGYWVTALIAAADFTSDSTLTVRAPLRLRARPCPSSRLLIESAGAFLAYAFFVFLQGTGIK